MVKFLKITPGGRVIECEDIMNHEEFKNSDTVGYSLGIPYIWEHNKYSLAMYVERVERGLFHNNLATDFYHQLRSNNLEDMQIHGNVYVANEDNEKEID